MVYGKTFHGALKTGLRNRKIADEVCDYKDVADDLQEGLEMLAAEKASKSDLKKKDMDDQEKTTIGDQAKILEPDNGDTKVHQDEDPETRRKHCHDTVRSHVSLHPEPKSATKVTDAIKASNVFMARIHPGEPGYIVILFDVKLSGESKWQPNVRVAPLRDDHFEKLVTGTLQAFDEVIPPKVQANQIWVMFDGFKHGLGSDFVRPFKTDSGKKLDASTRLIYCQYDPNTLNDRREHQWGAKTKNLVEYCTILTADELDFLERAFKHFPNITNRMDVLGPIVMDTSSSDGVWKMKVVDKKKLYGPARTAVGSVPGQSGADPNKKAEPRADAKEEPTFFLSLPPNVYESLFKAYDVKGVVNLTAGEGNVEVACMELGLPVVSFCHTEFHQTALYNRLEMKVWPLMLHPQSNLCQKRLTATMDAKWKDKPKADNEGEAKDKKTTRRKRSSGKDQDRAMAITPPSIPKPSSLFLTTITQTLGWGE